MTSKRIFLTLLVMGALALQACGASASAVATSVAATLQISQLETAAAGGGQSNNNDQSSDSGAQDSAGAQDSGQSSESSDSGAAEQPTATETPTPTLGVAMVSVTQDTNCRTGPRVDYAYVTTIEAGQQVEVLKTFAGANYVIVRNPNGSGECWLWLRYADQTDFSAYSLPAATQPPTPTATSTPTNTPIPYNWNGTWSIWVGGTAFTMTMTQSGGSVTATFPSGGDTVTLTGTTSNGGQNASGNWVSSGGPSGTFEFRLLNANLDQFIGNYNGGALAWCGARNGEGQPSPCMGP